MKKIKIAILLMIGFSLSLIGQEDSRDNLRLGVKVGANYSNIYATDGSQLSTDPKIGLAAGGFLAIPIGTYLGVQPEVMYSQKGYEGTGSFFDNTYNVKTTTSYIDVPLFITLKPFERLTLMAGPQYSYLVSRKDEYSSSTINIEQEQEFDNDNYRKNIMGAALGVDINFTNMVLGARASWDLQKNHGDGTSSTPRYKNTLVQATVGFVF